MLCSLQSSVVIFLLMPCLYYGHSLLLESLIFWVTSVNSRFATSAFLLFNLITGWPWADSSSQAAVFFKFHYILSFYKLNMLISCALVILKLVLDLIGTYSHTHWDIKMKVVMMVDVLPVARHMFIFRSCTGHDCIHFGFYFFVFL